MNQAGGGTWSHAVSHDGARWAHVQDALVAGARNSSWDHEGPCDGTVSFPDLGAAPYDGSTPIILYGQCLATLVISHPSYQESASKGGRNNPPVNNPLMWWLAALCCFC